MPGLLLPEIDRKIDSSVNAHRSTSGNLASVAWTNLTIPVVIIAIVALTSVGLFFQFTTYLNHDIAWILYSADLLLDGAVFGRDVIAANPPLAWYLSYPALIVAEITGVHPAVAYRAYVAFLTLVFLGWSGSLLRRSADHVRAGGVLLLVVATSTLFVGCFRDFGQREYLALILALPYLILTASRLSGYVASRFEAICIGVFAGLAFSLKPHFLGVPFFVELTAILYSRRLSFLIRPEALTGGAVVGSYVAFLTVFVPDYVFAVIPICRQVYWGFNQDFAPIVEKIRYDILGSLVLVFVVIRRPRLSPLFPILIAATLGFLLAYVSQRKGYSYHALPFRNLVMISLGFLLGNLHWHGKIQNKRVVLDSCVVCFALLALIFMSFSRTTHWYMKYNRFMVRPNVTKRWRGRPEVINPLIAFLNERTSADSFLAFSTHPFPAFPTALYVEPSWASRTNSRIFLPAIVKMREAGLPADDPRLLLAESKEREYTLRDLETKPTIVLVDTRKGQHGIGKTSFKMLDFYSEDPRFREAWSQYHELTPIGQYRIFERNESAP